ncbi:MAG: PKD domain-containing protein [Cytophagales bacterium]|nr:PKD domain-containing protein [Cytophagales bacterium]
MDLPFYTRKDLHHAVSRFRLQNDSLSHLTEETIITIPIDLEKSAHTGGSLAFDPKGNLFISIGDNTPPWFSQGHAPLDERPGRSVYDAQRTSANKFDLRGKILRITPRPERGGFTVPEGNLFPADGKQGRPEIYAMGCRNPYRISIDPRDGTLYWGEVGPDAGEDSPFGPRGYDEINRAKRPGNFGWPYFVGNNRPYPQVDFATQQVGQPFDPQNIVNRSVNVPEEQPLPAPLSAWIYYPYDQSADFPLLGSGGRTAMAGPFYLAERSTSVNRFPVYYDQAMLIYDWMRGWVMAVWSEADGQIQSMEPVLPHLKLANPIDMDFGPDGALYVLEYGYTWYSQNPEATLSRITYEQSNRSPLARLSLSDSVLALGQAVQLSAAASYDLDGDRLTYTWQLDGQVVSTQATFEHHFDRPGIYYPTLEVRDSRGYASRSQGA